ncbi:MAG: GntG family PLP-dependent aldolase [Gammaproteobacteria bacterium]|nr:GntG family PLP-dependent aldolase [Gammaproteobacteria bacterium]
MKTVDLRSDTFTLPDDGMRKAIQAAEVGNSAFGEDPSVNRLEETIADYFGMEGGIFLPSATMAGQIAFKVWTRPGDYIIIEEYGHGYYFETGAMGLISGAMPRLLPGERGILDPDDIRDNIEHIEHHYGRAALAVLENTSNYGGGTIYPQAVLDRIFKISKSEKLPIHVDGARIWNAIVETGVDPRRVAPPNGSMSVCFSKGLGAPIGAVLLGSKDFITEARRVQGMLGGVMRQVGFMAAAAQYGFEHNMHRLEQDHTNARLIAEGLADNAAIELNPVHVKTNILYFRVRDGAKRAARLIGDLETCGVKAWNLGDLVRLVTCLNVDQQDCEYAVEKLNEMLR